MALSSELLHADALMRIRHVRCRPRDHACGAAEATGVHALAFPLRGVFVRHLDDGRETVAHAGQAVFFNQGEIYPVSHPRGGDDCFTVELAEPLLQEVLEADDPHAAERAARPFHASHALLPAPAQLQERLLWHDLCDAHGALQIEERALDLAAAALAATQANPPRHLRSRPVTQRRRREQVRAAVVMLAVEPTQHWTLDELARRVHGSPFQLARTFRGEQGASIHQYLVWIRLAHALDAVLDSDASLTTIALAAGFATPSHFTAAFRARYDATPSALRHRMRAATARELRRISTAADRRDR